MLCRDSAFLARLVSGHLEGERGLEELSRVSPVFRPMAERLLRTPLERRQFVWIDFLAGRLRFSPVDQCLPVRRSRPYRFHQVRRRHWRIVLNRCRPNPMGARVNTSVGSSLTCGRPGWPGRVALAGSRAAGNDHDVRGRSQAGEELRDAGHGGRRFPRSSAADGRVPEPTGECDSR